MPYIHTYDPEKRDAFRRAYRANPLDLLRIDDPEAERLTEKVTEFYREHLDDAGMDGYVVGLSGGVDSTTVANLLVEAVSAENVQGVILPPPHADTGDVEPAVTVANDLGITTNDHGLFQERIGDVVDTLEGLGEKHDNPDVQRVKRGNVLARCRMIVIRDIARANNYLVAGTTNASERDLGYMTLAADGKGGVDNEAVYELYKTTERDLATYLGVPQDIVEKAPSADLWPGQTDEDELGFTYDVLDQVLVGLRLGLDPEAITDTVDKVDVADVEKMRRRVGGMQFKRELAPHPAF